jgi:hypothetical protein
VQQPSAIIIGLQHFGLLAALDGDARIAAGLLGYTDAAYRELGVERESTERWGREKLAEALQGRLSSTEIEALAAEGATGRKTAPLRKRCKAESPFDTTVPFDRLRVVRYLNMTMPSPRF